jgi:hypothetical protein
MRVDHKEKAYNPLDDLSRMDRICFNLAIITAFAAVFVWFFKILFF